MYKEKYHFIKLWPSCWTCRDFWKISQQGTSISLVFAKLALKFLGSIGFQSFIRYFFFPEISKDYSADSGKYLLPFNSQTCRNLEVRRTWKRKHIYYYSVMDVNIIYSTVFEYKLQHISLIFCGKNLKCEQNIRLQMAAGAAQCLGK